MYFTVLQQFGAFYYSVSGRIDAFAECIVKEEQGESGRGFFKINMASEFLPPNKFK